MPESPLLSGFIAALLSDRPPTPPPPLSGLPGFIAALVGPTEASLAGVLGPRAEGSFGDLLAALARLDSPQGRPNLLPQAALPSSMEVHVFDVEHGSCHVVITPAGRLLLIDCGHNDSTGWRPSTWIAARGVPIANLTVTNFDEDHLTDLPNILQRCRVETLTVNQSVSPEWIERRKGAPGMGPGVAASVSLMRQYNQPLAPGTMDWGGCSVAQFWHPLGVFTDENSLSVVTFIHHLGVRMIFPGDLTRQAWLKFLANPLFTTWLRDTNIFVASHHGRQDGYCQEVFDVCKPAVIIASDKSVMYETQVVNYSQHAKGIVWNGTDTRYFLTTRRDGKMTITPQGADGFWIEATPTR